MSNFMVPDGLIAKISWRIYQQKNVQEYGEMWISVDLINRNGDNNLVVGWPNQGWMNTRIPPKWPIELEKVMINHEILEYP